MKKPCQPLIIGHRGAKACEAENTLGSFRKAIAMGADMIEFDVHKCASGELVVIHDATLTRTTDGRGRVNRMTLKEIKRFHCGNGETVPTLQETITAVGSRVGMNVEIKTVACVKAVAKFFRKRDISGVEFSSFHWSALALLRRHLPKAKLGLLVNDFSYHLAPFIAARKLGCSSINPPAGLFSSALMKKARANKLRVLVYGLRSENDFKRCFTLGADGIFADNPAQVIAARNIYC
jgi:glycerophosphoryl diester phosphodiesterase